MNPKRRQDEIVALVMLHRDLSVEDLARRLSVSRETIRRDITRLAGAGLLRKYHGGARARVAETEAETLESPYALRLDQNAEAKREIARATAAAFAPGDSIFIDAGSTTVAVAEALAELSQLIVITNSVHIAALVGANRSNKVFTIGGEFKADVGESLGPLALEQIAKFRTQHALLTIGAMDGQSIMDFDLHEAEIARAMIDRVQSVTVVADHSKLGRKAVFEIAPLSRIARLITDRPPPPDLARALAAAGVTVLLAKAAAPEIAPDPISRGQAR